MRKPDRIEVALDYAGKCWTAAMLVRDDEWPGGFAPCPETVALFGTYKLPTPYALQASRREVLAGLRALNPQAVVEAVS